METNVGIGTIACHKKFFHLLTILKNVVFDTGMEDLNDRLHLYGV